MTVPHSRSLGVERTIVSDVKPNTSSRQASPPRPREHSAESADAAVATWLQLIQRYFQVNGRPVDRHDGRETTII
jgi:hypothetical protein